MAEQRFTPEEVRTQVAKMIAATDLKVMVIEATLPLGFAENPSLGEAMQSAFAALKRDIEGMQMVLRGLADPSSVEQPASERTQS